MREAVESFMSRSRMLATSREEILERLLCRSGAAYCALASQMKMLRQNVSPRRLKTNSQRRLGVRG